MKKLSLLASCLLVSGLSFGQTDLFFSEVIEGAGANNNDKAVEIYNPTNQAIDVSQYSIRRYNNGGSTPFQDEILMSTTGGSNMLQPGDVWVIIHPDPNINPQIAAVADQVSAAYDAGTAPSVILQGGAINANGNDAYELVKWVGGAPGSAGAVAQTVDIFGKIGEDPGFGGWNGFQVGPPTTISSANHSIMRKPEVGQGVTQNPSVFDITEEWVAYSVSNYGDVSLPEQNYSRLGEHADYVGPMSASESLFAATVKMYPNPANGAVKIEFVENFAGSLAVYNTLGQRVNFVQKNNNGRMAEFDVRNLSSGLYIVQFTNNNGAIAGYKNLIVQ